MNDYTPYPLQAFQSELKEIDYLITKLKDPYATHYYSQQVALLRCALAKQPFIFERIPETLKSFTVQEIEQNYNGKNGNPAYVIVEGMIYDVSLNPAWGGGTHFGQSSGKDLTGIFNSCHQGNLELLKNTLPLVGILKTET